MRGHLILNFIVGLVVAIASGLIGLGGAELRLPYLVGVLGLAAKLAVPLNLAVSLVTVAAALPFRLHLGAGAGMDHALVVFALIAGAMIAAYVGAGWLRRVSSKALEQSIAVLLVMLGLVMMLETVIPLVPAGLLPDILPVRVIAGIFFGLAIGGISGILGVAGGEVIIPTLVLGYGVPIALAGTLSLVVSLPTILVGLARHRKGGAFVNRAIVKSVVAPMAIGATLGAPLGAWLAAYVDGALIKALLGVLLIWSAWKVFGGRHS
jgi:uncharacterized membrane protein YfcA